MRRGCEGFRRAAGELGEDSMPYPRKPTALKRLQGNPGKRPLGREIDGAALTKVPSCPAWLEEDARKFFRTMGREVIGMGLLTQADVPALIALAVTWGRWVDAERKLAERGEVITTAAGEQRVNPWLTVSNRALDKFCDLLTQFGGTPASRTKFVLEHKKPFGVEDLEALIMGQIRAEQQPDPREYLREVTGTARPAEDAALTEG